MITKLFNRILRGISLYRLLNSFGRRFLNFLPVDLFSSQVLNKRPINNPIQGRCY